jgi:integrase
VRRYLYASSKDEVLQKLAEHIRRTAIGLGPVDARLTTASYLAAWADGLTGLRPRTVESYRFTVERHLIPHIGHVSLIELRAPDIRRAVRAIETDTGVRTAAYSLTVLRLAIRVAVEDRILERNEALNVRRPATDAPERQPLDAASARALLEQVRGDRLEGLWVVELATGMRRGEITALGWADVNLGAGTAKVTRTLSYRPGDSYALSAPKTKKSVRTIRLPVIAIEALRAQRQRQREERVAAGAKWRMDWTSTQLVFTTSVGGPLAGSTISHALHRHLAAAGLPRQRFHDLRHSAASILLEQGVDRRYVQDLLGHADEGMTRRYQHVAATSTVAADALDRALMASVAVTVAVNDDVDG